jgi:hypothetical protein
MDNRYAHIYPELALRREDRNRGVLWSFPLACPACGAELLDQQDHSLRSFARYACGGAYEDKGQIQNHTDKMWGHCPRIKAAVESGTYDLVQLAKEAQS